MLPVENVCSSTIISISDSSVTNEAPKDHEKQLLRIDRF